MGARYLVRFDDVCPTMNWAAWNAIEPVLDRQGIRPLVAVVPDNRDPELMAGAADPGFWGRVRAWQAKHWAVGLHGHQHVYETRDPGLVGLNDRSEFAGLPRTTQQRKLELGLAVFAREDVRTTLWIAPGHSFDRTTLSCLAEQGIRTISDGFYLYPGRDRDGFFWIPQQLSYSRWMPFGVWTICHHVNSWTAAKIARFEQDVERQRRRIVDVDWVLQRFSGRRLKVHDRLFGACWSRWLLRRRSGR
jgi:predicted deacetylase